MKVKKKGKREEKTDYRKRKRLLDAEEKRIVIRKSGRYITAQVVEYHPEGDKTLVGAKSSELKEYGWKGNLNNIPASYLTGFLVGKRAKEKDIEKCIADLGMNKPTKGSRIYACLKGFIDASISVPHSEEIFPSEERIRGEHIVKYGKQLKEKGEFEKIFRKENPLKIPELFEKVKEEIEE